MDISKLAKNAKPFWEETSHRQPVFREIEMCWGLDNSLPKIRQSQHKADTAPTAPVPQNGFKKF